MDSLDKLAEEIEEISNTLLGEDEDIRLSLSGCSTCASVHLEIPIWDTESDEREWNEDGAAHVQTVEEFTLDRLENVAADILCAVGKIREQRCVPDGKFSVRIGNRTLFIPVYRPEKENT